MSSIVALLCLQEQKVLRLLRSSTPIYPISELNLETFVVGKQSQLVFGAKIQRGCDVYHHHDWCLQRPNSFFGSISGVTFAWKMAKSTLRTVSKYPMVSGMAEKDAYVFFSLMPTPGRLPACFMSN